MLRHVCATAVFTGEDLADNLAHAAPLPTPGGVVPTCPDLPRVERIAPRCPDGVVRSAPGQETRYGDSHAPPLGATPAAPPATPRRGGDRCRVAGPDRLQRRRRR